MLNDSPLLSQIYLFLKSDLPTEMDIRATVYKPNDQNFIKFINIMEVTILGPFRRVHLEPPKEQQAPGESTHAHTVHTSTTGASQSYTFAICNTCQFIFQDAARMAEM